MPAHRLLPPVVVMAAAAAVLLALLPSTAAAATINMLLDQPRTSATLTIQDDRREDADGVRLLVDDGDGDEVRIAIVSVGDQFGQAVRGFERCRRASATSFVCPRDVRAALDDVQVFLGNGDDELRVDDVPARFLVEGRGGTDKLQGGPEADTIDVGAGVDRNENDLSVTARELAEGGPSVDVADGGAGDDTLTQTLREGDPAQGGALYLGGLGDDTIRTNGRDFTENRFISEDNIVRAGPGNDTVTGSLGADDLQGEDGDDVLTGSSGDDDLAAGRGADRLDAGRGDDRLLDGVGFLSTAAAPTAADGADTFSGSIGRDVLVYSGSRTARLEVTPNDQTANDGAVGEGDQILGIEDTTLAQGNDFFFGLASLDDNFVDVVTAGAGNDTVLTGDGNDRLNGGTGRDTLRGGSDDDVLFTRDGEPEAVIACDSGLRDEAFIDLTDPDPTGCELIERRPVLEEPNAELPGPRTLRRRGGRVQVAVRCPRAAKAGCRGTVSLRGARATYRLRRGARTTVALRAAPGAGTLVARQAGKKGPKTTTVRVRVR